MLPSQAQWQAALEARHGRALQEKFSAATVALCGLGGLGSHIALTLARAGVGKLILLDFDRVELSNLHRQQYKASQVGRYKTEALAENLREAAPYLSLELRTVRLTAENVPSLLEGADVICEAFDDPQAKAMLVDAAASYFPGKWLVAASGMAGIGSPNRICTRKLAKRMFLCGDGTSDAADGMGLAAPRVMLCAAHQALTVLRILAGETDV